MDVTDTSACISSRVEVEPLCTFPAALSFQFGASHCHHMRATMKQVRIEIDRGKGWETRFLGMFQIAPEEVASHVAAYAVEYPHRGFLDDALVAEVRP